MYRNAFYNAQNNSITVASWDEKGNRITYDATVEPYFYLEGPGEDKSIFGTSLKKKTFTSSYERYKFLKTSNIKRCFENFPIVQQFLIDSFWKLNETPEFTQHPIKVLFLDIEVYAPGEFPHADEAKEPVNVITVYDTLTKKYHTWGTGSYDNKDPDVIYTHCTTERQIFTEFFDFFESDYPDIFTGWNAHGFDIPYVINRANRLFGEDFTKRLSPANNVYSRTVKGNFGNDVIRWFIEGISVVDYLDLYKRFSLGQKESYKLASIAEAEVGESKVDFGAINLATLAETDWVKFVDYNIQDVKLLVKMEDKLKYTELLRMLAYVGLTTFEAAMGTITVITGSTAVRARYRGQKIPTFVRDDDSGKNPGAYVAEPLKGFQEKIISFDASSLYPSVMISLNTSPETKIGTFTVDQVGNYVIKHVSGKTYTVTPDKFDKFKQLEQLAISKANVLFTQKVKGIMPEILDYYYNKRQEIRKELKGLKQKYSSDKSNTKLKLQIDGLEAKQLCIKLYINSIYGFFGNKNAPFGDDDIAASITLTGQAVIKHSNDLLKKYVKERRPGISDEDLASSIIYNDTDSSYISVKHLFDNDSDFCVNGKLTDKALKQAADIESYLNKEIKVFGAQELGSKDCRFLFKREVIADTGIFLQKKRYVIRVLDDEGIPTNKFKYVGVEVARSTMPKSVKPYVKKIIEEMLSTRSEGSTNALVNETYEIFAKLKPEEIAFAVGVSNYDKYASRNKGYTTGKGVPHHIKAAYFYNRLIDDLGLSEKYEKIISGDKIRLFYVQTPNKYGITAIAYKTYYPVEFHEFFQPDYQLMFQKHIFSVVERFYDNVGWHAADPGKLTQSNLFDLFKA